MVVMTVGLLIGAGLPRLEKTLAQLMYEDLIRLDGVLFGFSAVMLGLFLRDFPKMSEKSFDHCLVFVTTSFLCYILSILLSFMGMAFGQQWVFGLVVLTVAGAISSSIYIIMTLVEEYYPTAKKNLKTARI
jgi:hypothetical protein